MWLLKLLVWVIIVTLETWFHDLSHTYRYGFYQGEDMLQQVTNVQFGLHSVGRYYTYITQISKITLHKLLIYTIVFHRYEPVDVHVAYCQLSLLEQY
jgi:hypothetical protein